MSSDWYGNAPDNSPTALILIDVINDLEFDTGPQLMEPALLAAHRIAELKSQAVQRHIPTIYVNDNFGKWQSNFHDLLNHVIGDHTRGQPVAELLKPQSSDYFVLKPEHSGFYATPLDLLLHHLGATNLILCGLVTEICIHYTAIDAYIRHYRIAVPSDCVASANLGAAEASLRLMTDTLKADIRPSRSILDSP